MIIDEVLQLIQLVVRMIMRDDQCIRSYFILYKTERSKYGQQAAPDL